MNKTLMLAFGAAALIGVPVAVVAADAVVTTVLMDPPANSATMMCRPAATTEKGTHAPVTAAAATAPTAGSQGTVVCKTMTAMTQGGKMQIPDTTKLDAAGTDRAWRIWLQQSLIIPPGGTGGG